MALLSIRESGETNEVAYFGAIQNKQQSAVHETSPPTSPCLPNLKKAHKPPFAAEGSAKDQGQAIAFWVTRRLGGWLRI
jgi:hypothetical protein